MRQDALVNTPLGEATRENLWYGVMPSTISAEL